LFKEMKNIYMLIVLVILLPCFIHAIQIPIISHPSASQSSITPPSSSNDIISCSEFDKKNIKLVTVDVFAALTLLDESLFRNIAQILPNITRQQVEGVVGDWENVYGDHLGLSFDVNVTGVHPFRWMLNQSLPQILQQNNITEDINATTITNLIDSWGNLILRPSAKSTFMNLSNAGYLVGPLSNGDDEIVSHAFSALSPEVKPAYVFTSDYPVMCFKNCTGMYHNVLNVSGFSVNEVLHVAGSMYDGRGARTAGLFSAVLKPDSHHRHNNTANYPCFILNDLSDLLSILL